MEFYIDLDSENRILILGSTKSPNGIKIDVPRDHEVVKNPFIYKYVGGELIRDDVFQNDLIAEKEKRASLPTTEEKLELAQQQLASVMMASAEKDSEIKDAKLQLATVMMSDAQKSSAVADLQSQNAQIMMQLAANGIV